MTGPINTESVLRAARSLRNPVHPLGSNCELYINSNWT